MKSKYAIVCGSRSGSTFLCDLLRSTIRAGNPQEFFNLDLRDGFAEMGTGKGYVDGVINGTKTENEVFGAKIVGFDQWNAAANSPLQFTDFIWLDRGNKVAQAISRFKSWKTNTWHTNKPLDVKYSFKDIKWCYDEIKKEDKFYQEFFSKNNHLKVSYEQDLISNKDQTVKCILNHLNVNSNELPKLESGWLKIADRKSKSMEREFRETLGLT